MPLPCTETVQPDTVDELAQVVRDAIASRTPIYPLGGCTALDYSLPARRPGIGLSTAGLSRVIDYPWQDMTITVEAGITMQALADLLAECGQRLPIDVAYPEQATLGGMVATNFSGPRRYGYGTLRDYVIGISAIDGHGTPFKAGGRVVKNVAGYDICKLLIGSLGTLGVITQVTLKVRPLAEARGYACCSLHTDFELAECVLASLSHSATTPISIDLLCGADWHTLALSPDDLSLLVGFEGSAAEVDWQLARLQEEWSSLGVKVWHVSDGQQPDERYESIVQRTIHFDAGPDDLLVKFSVRPSAVVPVIKRLSEQYPGAVQLSHAGNGILLARFDLSTDRQAAQRMIRSLQPLAQEFASQVVVWSAPQPEELTRQAWWGNMRGETRLMQQVKQQFDPHDLFNPGRFVYGHE